VLTVQSVVYLVVAKPVVSYSSAGYPIHHGFGEGLVSVVTLYIGKGSNYRVEYVLFVLVRLHYSSLAIHPLAGHSRYCGLELAFSAC